MAMKRFMVQADEELIERAKRRAADRGISVAQLVREALEREVGNGIPKRRLKFIGMFSSEEGPNARELTEMGPLPPVSSPFSDLPEPAPDPDR